MAETGNKSVHSMTVDLSLQRDVKRFAKVLLQCGSVRFLKVRVGVYPPLNIVFSSPKCPICKFLSVKDLCDRFPRLHYLVNNAGVGPEALFGAGSEVRKESRDKRELIMATNYLGVFSGTL